MKNLQHKLKRFRDERDWKKYHTPKNLCLALCGEVGELAEIFQWNDDVYQVDIELAQEEIADIIIYALNLCNALNLNAENIVRQKIMMNAEKYPIHDQNFSNLFKK